MNWDAIGAIGETLGSVILILTIGYMAIQVRNARQTSVDQNTLGRADRVCAMVMATVHNEELRMNIIDQDNLHEYYADLAAKRGVSIELASQTDWHNAYWFWVHWGQWSCTQDEKTLAELRNLVSVFYSRESMRRTWDTSHVGKVMFEPEFVGFVDDVLEEADSVATDDT